MTTYSLPNAARILKVAPSRLRYWKRTRLAVPRATPAADLVRPHEAGASDDAAPDPGESAARTDAEESPSSGDYDFRDLVGIRAVLTLLEGGISLHRIRRSIEFLRHSVPEIEDPLVALRLLSEGSGRMVVEHEGRLIEPDGQLLLGFARDEQGGEPAGVASIGAVRGSGENTANTSTGAAGPKSTAQSAGGWFERGCHLDSDPATYAEAVDAYRRAVDLDPDFADAHCNLGALFYNNGDRAAARRNFERCLRLEPAHVEAHFNLANLLEEDGCDEMSLHHYRAALEVDPFYPDLRVNLALLCEKLSLDARARDHWRRYLQLDPSGSWAEVARGRLED